MTELNYDPALPYLVRGKVTRLSYARYRNYSDAHMYAEGTDMEIIDTTPKPKIPEDADFLYIELKDGPYYLRKREDGSWVDADGSQFLDSQHLERYLKGEGDAEVTVLVRKEES